VLNVSAAPPRGGDGIDAAACAKAFIPVTVWGWTTSWELIADVTIHGTWSKTLQACTGSGDVPVKAATPHYTALRVSWGGEFIHAAPWSMSGHGKDPPPPPPPPPPRH
jgi:hypothetical protein